jgi:hypothetical protein
MSLENIIEIENVFGVLHITPFPVPLRRDDSFPLLPLWGKVGKGVPSIQISTWNIYS